MLGMDDLMEQKESEPLRIINHYPYDFRCSVRMYAHTRGNYKLN